MSIKVDEKYLPNIENNDLNEKLVDAEKQLDSERKIITIDEKVDKISENFKMVDVVGDGLHDSDLSADEIVFVSLPNDLEED